MNRRRVGRRSISLSNLDKVLLPPAEATSDSARSAGLTKRALVDYYEAIAPFMLVHLRDRAVVMERLPDGLKGDRFYQKQKPEYFPEWIRDVSVETSKGPQTQVACSDAATLVYLANQGVLTLHPWLSRVDRLDDPDLLIVDVDPPGDDFEAARATAMLVRELFESLDATVYARTTGSRGIHVVVPLDRRASFDEARAFATEAMKWLARRHPAELTTEHRIAKRGRRVFLDVGRNAYGQTAVASYAVRARPGAPVAMPVEWSELEDRTVTARTFTTDSAVARMRERDDPWKGMRRHARSVARLAERFRALVDES